MKSINNHLGWGLLFVKVSILLSISLLPIAEAAEGVKILDLNDTDSNNINLDPSINDLVIEGWTPVSKKWPLNSQDSTQNYFVKYAKKLSCVDVKLPAKLDYDLRVKLEYFYDYAIARPTVQIVPCSKNMDVINETNQTPMGQWNTYEIIIEKEECEKRNKLAFNVLLHDNDDVFAWRLLEIKSILPVESNQSNPVTLEQNEGSSDENNHGDSDNHTVTSTTTTTASPTTTTTPTTRPTSTTTSTTRPTSTTTTTTRPTTTTTSTARPTSTTTTTTRPTPTIISTIYPAYTTTSTARPTPTNITFFNPAYTTISTTRPNEPLQPLPDLNSNQSQDSVNEDTTDSNENNISDTIEYKSRPRSMKQAVIRKASRRYNAETPAGEKNILDISCKPNDCNRDLFQVVDFMNLIKGLPTLPEAVMLDGQQRFFVNTENQPLYFRARSTDNFYDLNTCLDIEIYMEPGTELDFFLESDEPGQQDRLLEVLRNREQLEASTSSGTSRWNNFKRCISDYMPKLKKPENSDDRHNLVFKFVPKHTSNLLQVAVLSSVEKPVSLTKLYPSYDYIQNVVTMPETADFGKYWELGSKKQDVNDFKLDSQLLSGKSTKVFTVADIDPTGETLELKSRWLKINNTEDESVANGNLFMYEIEKDDWIESIEFEHQNSPGDGNNWTKRTIYVAPEQKPAASGHDQPTSKATDDQGIDKINDEETDIKLSFPITLTGVSGDDYRIRLIHRIKDSYRKKTGDQSITSGEKINLKIYTLALGDVCAYGTYCKNNATCEPTGMGKAKCICLPGYSGPQCDSVNHCEVIYRHSNQTGQQLCESIGSKCVQGLPVYKCIWPDDHYYQCKANFATTIDNSTGNIVPVDGIPDENSAPNDGHPVALSVAEQIEDLKEQSRNHRQTVIILSVFMGAMMLFSIVIIVNLINRLMKSKRQLKEAKSEMYEFSRRTQPTTSAGATGPGRYNRYSRPTSGSAAGTLNYNNQAFDAD